MKKIIQRINTIVLKTEGILADNPEIGLKEFEYCINRIAYFENRLHKQLKIAIHKDFSSLIEVFEARCAFYKAYAVGKTRMNNSIGELTEE